MHATTVGVDLAKAYFELARKPRCAALQPAQQPILIEVGGHGQIRSARDAAPSACAPTVTTSLPIACRSAMP
jgi:hypothetical protein